MVRLSLLCKTACAKACFTALGCSKWIIKEWIVLEHPVYKVYIVVKFKFTVTATTMYYSCKNIIVLYHKRN